jgi:predicted metal-dependent HD superfamily phosphohydrolase
MNWPGGERWARLWEALGARGDPLPWYERLTTAYAEPQRHYHTQQHIAECLAEFDGARDLARHPWAVEAAIWFHDAVYKPRASDNEEQSAKLARSCFDEAGVSTEIVNHIAQLIVATKSHEAGADPDAALMIDVDLAIFGQSAERFAEYEEQIRKEYAWVPKFIYGPKRAQIVEGFLKRERIYVTGLFHAKYDAKARRNLRASINKLSKRRHDG